MSQITKILTVLLSILSIFLCGVAIAFVVNTNDYKKLYLDEQSVSAALRAENATYGRQYDEQLKKTAELKAQLSQQIQALEDQNNKLTADLRNAERLGQEAQARADSWKGVLTGLKQSVANLQKSLEMTQDKLDKARERGIRDQKELNQITGDLYEKIVQLQAMEAERKRLLEEKKDLETQLNGYASVGGPAPAAVVTPIPGKVHSVSPVTYGSDISGVLVDVNRGMATLSIGSADGVQKDMIFHVTRGSQFVCDVVITNVDINQAAGVLELVEQIQPRVGDSASTKL